MQRTRRLVRRSAALAVSLALFAPAVAHACGGAMVPFERDPSPLRGLLALAGLGLGLLTGVGRARRSRLDGEHWFAAGLRGLVVAGFLFLPALLGSVLLRKQSLEMLFTLAAALAPCFLLARLLSARAASRARAPAASAAATRTAPPAAPRRRAA